MNAGLTLLRIETHGTNGYENETLLNALGFFFSVKLLTGGIKHAPSKINSLFKFVFSN
jgi:hypothetical protein